MNQDDRNRGSLVDQIKCAAGRDNVELPEGWKPEVARRIVLAWSVEEKEIPKNTLDRAELLFKELKKRFEDIAL